MQRPEPGPKRPAVTICGRLFDVPSPRCRLDEDASVGSEVIRPTRRAAGALADVVVVCWHGPHLPPEAAMLKNFLAAVLPSGSVLETAECCALATEAGSGIPRGSGTRVLFVGTTWSVVNTIPPHSAGYVAPARSCDPILAHWWCFVEQSINDWGAAKVLLMKEVASQL